MENPYQAPLANDPPPIPAESFEAYAEEVRRQHLGQEAQIKSIGSLYYLGGIGSIIGIASLIATAKELTTDVVGGLAITALFIPVHFLVGYGLHQFKTWARITALVFAFLGLFLFPVGTVICAIAIVLLLLKKNTMIFSPAYKEIVAATPHIKRKGSISYKIALVFLAVILLLALAGFAVTFFGSKI
jgi:hypothetical protein